jgi:PAS domain S-box-containing protein
MFLKTIIHPDSRASFDTAWTDILAGRVPPACEYKIIDREKKERWIFQSHKGLFDSQGNILGIEGICRDITQRKILEKQLQAIASEWYATFDAINDPIALLNSQRIILRCNKALTILTGKSYSCLVGRSICETIHNTPAAPRNCPFLQMKESRKRENVIMFLAEHWFNVSVDPIFDAAGNLTGAVHIMNDISAQKKAEDNLRTQQEQLLQADKMITLGILVSGMAHEINNPNNSIALNSQFLEKAWQSIMPILDEYYTQDDSLTIGGIKYEKFKKKLPALFSGISDSSKRIRHIVDDLKAFSRKESLAAKTPTDINSVVKSAVNLMNNIIKKSTHHFKFSCGKNLPMIKGNFQGLEQVIINLVQNACQALSNPEQGILISTFYDNKSNQLIVSVKDEGIGIPEKNMKYIMEPFFTTRRTAGGTGLGLTVSARIAAEHNATLYFISAPGKGTDARIRFQVDPAELMMKKRRKDD